ncbi:NAD(P)-binding protein [Aspergillus steynii IBT 23096]|uniref:NAD(P)-binding protein n=1 Tax=Aspergillus steynii IBT 23096 TaxID=1392250 RepID=A0A2I2GI51_9EURO|nr:NAD(P)-binding protein [Aspergillus steynii IBT 23096]PLB52556.1 NAD(P)-binding protein [Aspergillus steynii IBT 23096]
MPPRIFIGDILYCASRVHPDWEWTCLVRSEEKGAKVAAEYPQVRLVYGTTDDSDLLEEEASKADTVFHSAASDDHVPSAQAILQGLGRRAANGPAYYIHTSGGFALAAATLATGKYGERFDKIYDDWDHVDELTSLPDHAPHRKVDKVVLAADPSKVRTAIVAPAVIYGKGRGPDKKKSAPVSEPFLRPRRVFVVGKGENIWHNIHVQDLTQLYLLLGEAAVNGGGSATWNAQGYYLAENGSYVNRKMLKLASSILYKKGLVSSPEPEEVTVEQSESILPWLKIMVGVDSQGIARRGRKLLGWSPTMPTFEDELEAALETDARAMGLSQLSNAMGAIEFCNSPNIKHTCSKTQDETNNPRPVCTQCTDPTRCIYPESGKRGLPQGYITHLETRLASTEQALFAVYEHLRSLGLHAEIPEGLGETPPSRSQTRVAKMAEWERLPLTGRGDLERWWTERRGGMVGYSEGLVGDSQGQAASLGVGSSREDGGSREEVAERKGQAEELARGEAGVYF